MTKEIKGVFRFFKKNKKYGVEMSKNMDEATELCFAGMIIELLAQKHGVPQEKMAEILIDGNKVAPMDFEIKKTYVLCNDEQDCIELISIDFDEILSWGYKWIKRAYSDKHWKSKKEDFLKGANVGIYWLATEENQ